MATVGKMRAQHIKGETEKYLKGGAADPQDELRRKAAAQTEQAVGQALGAQQRDLGRAAMAQTGGSPIAPGGMVAGAQAQGREAAEASARGTSEANRLAAAVREKKRAQALGAAERLSTERFAKGMAAAKMAATAADAAAESAKTVATLGLV